MTMITPSYLGETIEYSSLHACRSTLEDPTLYFDLLRGLGRASHTLTPSLAVWTVQEREICSHFAAVVLDRSISSIRNLFAQQAPDGL